MINIVLVPLSTVKTDGRTIGKIINQTVQYCSIAVLHRLQYCIDMKKKPAVGEKVRDENDNLLNKQFGLEEQQILAQKNN